MSSTEFGPTLSLSRLLSRAVLGAREQKLGHLSDVIVRLRGVDYPLVTGLVADLGGRRVFVPADAVTDWNTEQVVLASSRLDLREFERRDGEVLLRTDILGHRLIDIPRARLVRAYDLELAPTSDGWVLAGVDTRKTSWWRRLLGKTEPAHEHHGDHQREEEGGGCRDWKAFEALIGHEPTVLLRGRTGRLRGLKPPQIADLLEEASREEQTELLAHVHADPELEADVFEELDDDRQSRLLRDRPDPEIAAVLARMRADDAADAIADLPQDRRKPVLELLPAGQRTKVTALLGYNPTSAGGLMGLDFVALHRGATVADALERVRNAKTLQPEALTTVFSLNPHGKLRGAASLVALLQADPAATLRQIAEPDPVRVHPDADLIDITLLVTDYNLLNLPVVDEEDHLIGVITVDDVLESSVPRNWRRREPTPHPDTTDEVVDDENGDGHAQASPQPASDDSAPPSTASGNGTESPTHPPTQTSR
ncbi:magnesium transporter MgtE N-terminal domain-containing protein [Pseudonocardia sp. Cha107L01]|uniref:magnesium transporter MgtE N-terminal domain-containing protein n=1 Tax=Pseudonocardia sp. Cha107L01 TaxID=3457576 RepID=UPI00403EE30A